MSWHPSIPNEVNVVRGAAGDLAFSRENFDLLSGVATRGISGLMNASGTGAPASGDVVSFRSVASGWLTSGLRLDTNLRDVLVPTATSGQALTYSGTHPTGKWISSTPVQTVSGLTDVQMNPPTPLSGQALVYSGTHPTGKWTPSGIQITTLDSIGDVTITAAVSGQFLRWTGTAWVNSDADAAPQLALRLSGTGLYTVTGASNEENQVLFQELAFQNGAGFSYNLTSGQIIVSGGVWRVDLLGQATINSAAPENFVLGFRINGLALSGVSGYGLAVSGSRWPAANSVVQVHAMGVPVVSGDRITLVSRHDDATDRTLSGQSSFLHARKSVEVGGAGAGGVTSRNWQVGITLSGTNASIPNNSSTVLSGYTATGVNSGNWVVDLASGTITFPASMAASGANYVQVIGRANWATDADGRRQIAIVSGTAGVFVGIDAFPCQTSVPGNASVVTVTETVSVLIPVTGSEVFAMSLNHTAGAALNVSGTATHLYIRAFVLA